MKAQPRVLEPGHTCWALEKVDESGVIIDAEAYYRAIHRAISGARRYVLMSGWQFDTDVELVRGAEARAAAEPANFLKLLDFCCSRNPELHIHMLAWDFSPVYAIERVWFNKQRFTWRTNDRIVFEWDRWLNPGASHHQKFVVVDGLFAFAGGMDVCSGRWDGRDHLADNPRRVSSSGSPQKPYHDVQAFVRGPAVAALERLFLTRWQNNDYGVLDLPRVDAEPPTLAELCDTDAFRIRAERVALSQTSITPRGSETGDLRQIRDLYRRAVAGAERLIYIENQYFTSRSLTRALVERLGRKDGSALQVIVVLPRGGDTKKEKLALGDAQTHALGAIARAAAEHGHSFRLYYPLSDGGDAATFVHSKLLIVDDRLLSVGSANTTNRSFGLDSELNVSWQAEVAETEADIRRIRASLLAEHSGSSDQAFLEIDGLIERLDVIVSAGARLRPAELEEMDDADPLISLATDPDQPVDSEMVGDRIDEAWESLDDVGFFRAALERLGARIGKADQRSDET